MCKLFWLSFVILFVVGANGDKLEQFLDPDQRFLLRWEVVEERILFEVECQTKGWVGLGISPNGGMENADMIIGGVRPDGSRYFSDRFGVGNTMPVLDQFPDWYLTSASENDTHTILHFWRLLNTCDDMDFPISKDTSRVIWAIGEEDPIGYHMGERGGFSINFLDPKPNSEDISKFKRIAIAKDMVMPHQDTSYFCSIHKIYADKKLHIVGFDAILENEAAIKHTHHFVVYACDLPKESHLNESIFEEHVGGEGNHCYLPDEEQTLPVKYCQKYLFVWGNGGRRIMYPDHVGFPIGETPGFTYYMLEIHFDNPDVLEGVRYNSGVELYYTDKLRPYDSAMLTTGLVVNVAQTIPPNSEHFLSAGHCAPDCTSNFPPQGIKIFNVMLHSHLYGRKIKLRHFRNSTELPFILNDANYDFASQQNRPLSEEALVLPGDHLILECEYDTRKRNGLATTGGLSTRHEMCQTFIWYYPKSSLEFCTSTYPVEEIMEDFGIKNITYSEGEREPIILEPADEMNNLNYSTFLNTKVKWDKELNSKMEARERFSEHDFYCSSTSEGIINTGRIAYPPIVKAYETPDPCKVGHSEEEGASREKYRNFRDKFVASFDRNGVRKDENNESLDYNNHINENEEQDSSLPITNDKKMTKTVLAGHLRRRKSGSEKFSPMFYMYSLIFIFYYF